MTRGLLLIFIVLLVYSCGGGDVAVTQTGNPSQVSLYTQVGSKKAQNTTVTAKRTVRDDDEEKEEVTAITITSAKIVVDEVVLQGDDEDDLIFQGDSAYVINVALDSSRQLIDSMVDTSGSVFTSAKLHLTPLSDSDAKVEDSLLIENSIVITGVVTYVDGSRKIFTFTSDYDEPLNIELDTPFVVNNKGTSALFITLDVGTWFQNDDGELFDPFDDEIYEEIEDDILDGIYGSEEDEDDWDDDDEEEDDDEKDEEEEEEDEEE